MTKVEWTGIVRGLRSVQLLIPGLRGQPAAVAVLFSTTTISVSVFQRVAVYHFAREY
jgi:hypothetical protein